MHEPLTACSASRFALERPHLRPLLSPPPPARHPPMTQLGDSLMHNYYTIFEYAHAGAPPRVGLAALGAAEEALRAQLDALLAAPIGVETSGGARARGARGVPTVALALAALGVLLPCWL